MLFLSLFVIIPAVAALLLALVPEKQKLLVCVIPALASTICLGMAVWMFVGAVQHNDFWTSIVKLGDAEHPQDRIEWVKSLGITWSVRVDGMSAAMVLLTSIVLFAGSLVSIHAPSTHTGIGDRPKTFFILFLALVTGVYGVFLVRDLF